MVDNLVIVESPAKAETIKRFLGKDYTVKSSFGHIRDLQDNKLSIDVEHGFQPEYVIPAGKKKIVSELKKAAAGAKTVWLASDEDREGEAISWHLSDVLGLKPETTRRIVFHEITRDAILQAVEHPRTIDMDMVNAQQARRVLDRLVGFELSPILWRKIQPKLSAGRVQSVALRLVVDREKEIMDFKSEAFYRVEGTFHPVGAPASIKIKAVLDNRLSGIDEARKFLSDSIGASYAIASVEKKEGVRIPAAPFTTSTLQQEASRKLRFPVSTTMRIAQGLYERGLITYMRTDSTNLSALAINTAKKYIDATFGPEYSRIRQFKTRSKGAQEAHEAIRPTYIDNVAIEGTPQEKKLYNLIWKRTVASQMADMKVMATTLGIASDRRPERFTAQATEILFDGFFRLYAEGRDDEETADNQVLPALAEGEILEEKGLNALCKFTVAPPRYSEATLVKKLEELGIGRPSTYAQIISTLTTGRGYLVKGDKEGRNETVENLSLSGGEILSSTKTETIGAEKGKLLPQEIGIIVSDYLVGHFSDIMDYDFTARVEKDFDDIAEGAKPWNGVIASFYSPFHRQVEETLGDRQYSRVSRVLGTDPATGDQLIAKFGQFGPYVQKGEGEKRQFASLGKGQLIENITLEEALRLFDLPRRVGEIDGVEVIVTKGRFGPYIRFGGRNVSLPRGVDPLRIDLEGCRKVMEEAESARKKEEKKSENEVLATFGEVELVNGRYGAYLRKDGKNYKIPRGMDPSTLTAETCEKIVSEQAPTRASSARHRRFAAANKK